MGFAFMARCGPRALVALAFILSTKIAGVGGRRVNCSESRRHYRLTHLCSSEKQRTVGPMQDDEMLLLYAFIRVTRSARVLELGGMRGDSARNFIYATTGLPMARVYTVDLIRVKSQGDTHVTLAMDATNLRREHVDGAPLDLILLDCHHYNATMHTLRALWREGLIQHNTTLALHDTGLHEARRDPGRRHAMHLNRLRAQPDLVVHQLVERLVVEELRSRGIEGTGLDRWSAVHAHRDRIAEGDALAFRHGLTLMQLDRKLDNDLVEPYRGIGADTGYTVGSQ